MTPSISPSKWKKLLYGWRSFFSAQLYDRGSRRLHPRSHKLYTEIMLPFALSQQPSERLLTGALMDDCFLGYMQPSTLTKLIDYVEVGFDNTDLVLAVEELVDCGAVIPVQLDEHNQPIEILTVGDLIDHWEHPASELPRPSLLISTPISGPRDPSVFFDKLPKHRVKIIEDIWGDRKRLGKKHKNKLDTPPNNG